MAEVIYSTTFLLRRGTAEVWNKNNPILKKGEPAFVIDENRLKVGDGVRAWKELPYIGESQVIDAATHLDFPSVGNSNVIYKASEEKRLYQWNSNSKTYEVLSSGEVTIDIKLIHGGDASGTT